MREFIKIPFFARVFFLSVHSFYYYSLIVTQSLHLCHNTSASNNTGGFWNIFLFSLVRRSFVSLDLYVC